MTTLVNSSWDKTKKSNCDKTQKLKLRQKLKNLIGNKTKKTQIMTKLKTSNKDKTKKNSNCDKTKKGKFWQNSRKF